MHLLGCFKIFFNKSNSLKEHRTTNMNLSRKSLLAVALLSVAVQSQWVALLQDYCDQTEVQGNADGEEAGFTSDCGSFCYQYSSFSAVQLWPSTELVRQVTSCSIYSDNDCTDYISNANNDIPGGGIQSGSQGPGWCVNNQNGWGNSIRCFWNC